MIPPALPPDEPRRQAALDALRILDTAPDARFGRLVRFLAGQLDAPMAYVNLVDGARQWVRGGLAHDGQDSPRELSFCGHAILQEGIFVIEDATQDARFHDNPFVTGAPFVRFYAAVPVHAPGGERIGALCIVDSRPRTLDAIGRALLHTLGTLADEALAGADIPAGRHEVEATA